MHNLQEANNYLPSILLENPIGYDVGQLACGPSAIVDSTLQAQTLLPLTANQT